MSNDQVLNLDMETIRIDYASRAPNRDRGMVNGVFVPIKTGYSGDVILWCAKHVNEKWNLLNFTYDSKGVRMVFSDQTDAVMFKLTNPEWCK